MTQRPDIEGIRERAALLISPNSRVPAAKALSRQAEAHVELCDYILALEKVARAAIADRETRLHMSRVTMEGLALTSALDQLPPLPEEHVK